MFTLQQLVVLALSGTTLAAPAIFKREWQYGQGHWHGGWGHQQESSSDVVVVTETASAVATQMRTATATATATATMAYNTPVASATAATTTAPATTVATASSAPAPTGSGYMVIVNQYREAGGLKDLINDSKLEANALKTVKDSNGKMVHELNSGSMAQVLAPGNADDFQSVYVGGWLCEKPTLAGLNGICATEAQGWDHSDGETGHADILTSDAYSKIGCALYAGIWACDLA